MFQAYRKFAFYWNLILFFQSSGLLNSSPLIAGESEQSIEHNSEDFGISRWELQELIAQLAEKVNLFSEIWTMDPDAEIYAGSARDFVYWILGQFKDLKGKSTLEKKAMAASIKTRLLALEVIDSRKILGAESDCDVLSQKQDPFKALKPEDFNIRKIDIIPRDRLDPDSEMGRSEIFQGYIPAEKMRLRPSGIVENSVFGDPLSEILDGKLTLVEPNEVEFWATYYASMGLNHPVLLALRYIRLLAQDYGWRFGSEEPNISKTLQRQDPKIVSWIKKTIDNAIGDSKFESFLSKEQSRKWLSASILRAFRNQNPTATFQLLHYFGVDALQAAYQDQIPSLHGFLLRPKRDLKIIAENWLKYFPEARPEDLWSSVEKVFPKYLMFHGAGSDLAFRSLIYQGIIPSVGGTYGSGFYGVSERNLSKAENFARTKSGNADLLVKVEVSPDAKILDIHQGEGEILFQRWTARNPHGTYDDFAEAFGIDILFASHHSEEMVVKNRSVLGRTEGFKIAVRSLEELIQIAKSVSDVHDIVSLFESIRVSRLVSSEQKRLFKILKENPKQILKIEEQLRTERYSHHVEKLKAINLLARYMEDPPFHFLDLWISIVRRVQILKDPKDEPSSRDEIFLNMDEFRSLLGGISESQMFRLLDDDGALSKVLLFFEKFYEQDSHAKDLLSFGSISGVHFSEPLSAGLSRNISLGRLAYQLALENDKAFDFFVDLTIRYGPIMTLNLLVAGNGLHLFENILMSALKREPEKMTKHWLAFVPFVTNGLLWRHVSFFAQAWSSYLIEEINSWISRYIKKNSIFGTDKIFMWALEAAVKIRRRESWGDEFRNEILNLLDRLTIESLRGKNQINIDLIQNIYLLFARVLQSDSADFSLVKAMLQIERIRQLREFGASRVFPRTGSDHDETLEHRWMGHFIIHNIILKNSGFNKRLTPELSDIILEFIENNPLGTDSAELVAVVLGALQREIQVDDLPSLIPRIKKILTQYLKPRNLEIISTISSEKNILLKRLSTSRAAIPLTSSFWTSMSFEGFAKATFDEIKSKMKDRHSSDEFMQLVEKYLVHSAVENSPDKPLSDHWSKPDDWESLPIEPPIAAQAAGTCSTYLSSLGSRYAR